MMRVAVPGAPHGQCVSLMSRFAPGLYACGELMDVDGECGGYNLMWVWASALTVAEGILAEMRGAGKEKGR